jgi:predicted transcriptional regulator
MAAKKDRIGSDPLSWIKDTRGDPEEKQQVGISENKKVARSEGTKVGTSESEKVRKSEGEKKGKKSFLIAQNVLDELALVAWFLDKSDSAIVEVALRNYLSDYKELVKKAKGLRKENE